MKFIKKTICYALFFSALNASAITNQTVINFVDRLEEYAQQNVGFKNTLIVHRGDNGRSLAIEKTKNSDDWFSIRFYRENEQSPFTLEFSARKKHESFLLTLLERSGAFSPDRNNISKLYEEGMVRYTMAPIRRNEPFLFAVASNFVKVLYFSAR